MAIMNSNNINSNRVLVIELKTSAKQQQSESANDEQPVLNV
jgi:hypothetical protein